MPLRIKSLFVLSLLFLSLEAKVDFSNLSMDDIGNIQRFLSSEDFAALYSTSKPFSTHASEVLERRKFDLVARTLENGQRLKKEVPEILATPSLRMAYHRTNPEKELAQRNQEVRSYASFLCKFLGGEDSRLFNFQLSDSINTRFLVLDPLLYEDFVSLRLTISVPTKLVRRMKRDYPNSLKFAINEGYSLSRPYRARTQLRTTAKNHVKNLFKNQAKLIVGGPGMGFMSGIAVGDSVMRAVSSTTPSNALAKGAGIGVGAITGTCGAAIGAGYAVVGSAVNLLCAPYFIGKAVVYQNERFLGEIDFHEIEIMQKRAHSSALHYELPIEIEIIGDELVPHQVFSQLTCIGSRENRDGAKEDLDIIAFPE